MKTAVPNVKLTTDSHARAFGPSCNGCRATQSDIMLSLGPRLTAFDGGNVPVGEVDRILDVFLSRSQAETLYQELGERLANFDRDKEEAAAGRKPLRHYTSIER